MASTAMRVILPSADENHTSTVESTDSDSKGPPSGPAAHTAAHAPAPPPPAPASPAAPPASPVTVPIAVSPTLAANEAMSERKLRGEQVLPLAFGEAGLPAHPALRLALAEATGRTGYGPVAGQAALREAAAGYWERRGLPTRSEAVVCGPGSKALLFGLMLAIGADVAVPRPSWVSYAAQASLIGVRPHFVDTPPGQGGVPDPDKLAHAVTAARSDGREIRSVIVTLPDNPTGTLATPGTVRALCEVAEEHGLIIISDEIYRDLVYDTGTPLVSPAAIAPDRTIVTTALSKSLALGGWRIGVARLPDSAEARPLRRRLRDRLLGIGSEIWSAPAAPIQQAAAFAFSDAPELAERIALSRRLHAAVARAVADRFTAAGADVPRPQAAFYLYPDFGPARDLLRSRDGVTTSAELAALLLERYGVGVLPGSAFGEDPAALRLRVATGLLYGETNRQREAALASAAPLDVPWIAASLARVEEVLTDLTG
jgi:aspartate/methionine/tyrosine aminotransferase